ncbi:type IV secretory system conjugative DNA transfer family protein [Apilactobacillus timberlakei]|uniref:type IV secretory system conjugative DNA transfer family protein n=1 Tax=Apilactobacillus timberlakei TaxID=2008380 RepID=UPI00112DA13D|nr:type IV secretory system conjugative DNA transfer family protein [Apilactobacillus timberlakei]TPR16718.1 hypothetical protein DYZ95_06990 [Apilactobacillus timberlakei]
MLNLKDKKSKDTKNNDKKNNGKIIPVVDAESVLLSSLKLAKNAIRHPRIALRYAYLKHKDTKFLDEGTTGEYYITYKLQNGITYGITRSGKGKMIIDAFMDLNSRASHKQNFLMTDPKGENAAAKHDILKKRGFAVYVLNLLDIMHSMGFDPLKQVTRAASLGNVIEASSICSELAATIYPTDNAQGNNEKFFNKSSANLFKAIVFALLANAHSSYYADKHPELSYDSPNKSAYDKVTMYNVVQFVSQLGGTSAARVNTGEVTQRITIYFQHLSKNLQKLRDSSIDNRLDDIEQDQLALLDQATMAFNQTKLSGDETAGNIYSTFVEELAIYQDPGVAKMTSKNSMNPLTLGFDHVLTLQFDRGFKLQEFSMQLYQAERDANGNLVKEVEPIETTKINLDEVGLAQIPITNSINTAEFIIDIQTHHERLQGNQDFSWKIIGKKSYYHVSDYNNLKQNEQLRPLTSDMEVVQNDNGSEKIINKYTREPMFKEMQMNIVEKPHRNNFAKERIGNSALNLLADENRKLDSLKPESLDFMYDERPTALFLVTPPDKTELNQLGTFLINQIFNTLSNFALRRTKNREVQRPLQMYLDEIANIPPIPKLGKKVTIGLSQKIAFMLFLQDKEQLISNYGEEQANTIISNCSITNYILSKSQKTAEEVSKAVGERTVETRTSNTNNRVISSVGVQGYHSGRMAQTILPVTKLMHLKEGEMVVLRANDRQDNEGKSVMPLPIFNTGKTIMPYSFWFLQDSISNKSLLDVPIVTPHKYINPEDTLFDYNKIYRNMELQDYMDSSHLQNYKNDLINRIDALEVSSEQKDVYQQKIISIDNAVKSKDSSITNNDVLPKLVELNKIISNSSYKELRKLVDVTKQMFQIIKGKQSKALELLENLKNDESFDNLVDFTQDVRYDFDSKYSEIIDNETLEEDQYLEQIVNLVYKSNQEVFDYDEVNMNVVFVINKIFRKYFVNNNILQSDIKLFSDDMGNEEERIVVSLTTFGEKLLSQYEEFSQMYSEKFHDFVDQNLDSSDPQFIFEYVVELLQLLTSGKTVNDKSISVNSLFDDDDSSLLGYNIFLILANRNLVTGFIQQSAEHNSISFTNYLTYIFGVFDKFIAFAKLKEKGISNNSIVNIPLSDNYNVFIQDLVHLSDIVDTL